MTKARPGTISYLPTHRGEFCEHGGDLILTFDTYSINLGMSCNTKLVQILAQAPVLDERLAKFRAKLHFICVSDSNKEEILNIIEKALEEDQAHARI